MKKILLMITIVITLSSINALEKDIFLPKKLLNAELPDNYPPELDSLVNEIMIYVNVVNTGKMTFSFSETGYYTSELTAEVEQYYSKEKCLDIIYYYFYSCASCFQYMSEYFHVNGRNCFINETKFKNVNDREFFRNLKSKSYCSTMLPQTALLEFLFFIKSVLSEYSVESEDPSLYQTAIIKGVILESCLVENKDPILRPYGRKQEGSFINKVKIKIADSSMIFEDKEIYVYLPYSFYSTEVPETLLNKGKEYMIDLVLELKNYSGFYELIYISDFIDVYDVAENRKVHCKGNNNPIYMFNTDWEYWSSVGILSNYYQHKIKELRREK